MSTKVAVIIPTHKEELNAFEKISLAQARKVLGKYQFVFVVPEGKNFSYFESGDEVAHFQQKFFQSLKDYNRLMMSPLFYERFLSLDYILIYELDAFVFYDALEFFCELGYDYIGAPWPVINSRRCNGKLLRVGNSGFSLRKVSAHYNVLSAHQNLVDGFSGMGNDDFFACCGVEETINFRTAPVYVAARFSAEYLLEHAVKNLGNKLPFGCHGWSKMSADFYVKNFLRFGYDLRPLKNQMKNSDREIIGGFLRDFALQRLIHRVARGQSALQYLPTKKFSSVRVVRASGMEKILAGMIQEDSTFTDKIFLCDAQNYPNLLDGVAREDLPHLVLSSEHDETLTNLMEERGLVYGRHVISFRREYLRHCEKIFHSLGK